MRASVEFNERQIPASMLLQNDAVSTVLQEGVRAFHYSSRRHSLIHDTIIDACIDTRGQVDAVKLSEILEQAGHLETVGGYEYLIEIIETLPALNRLADLAEAMMLR